MGFSCEGEKRAYSSWASMKARCSIPTFPAYKDYGAKGIKVYDPWIKSFAAFYRDMGPRPKGTTLDRINSKGDYEPDNCRWATRKEQAWNSVPVKAKMFDYKGERLPLNEIARRTGWSQKTLWHRIRKQGMSLEEAVETPLLKPTTRGKPSAPK